MPSFSACWRSAPTVRFICFEIFETGILAFECFRSSACIAFVHAAPLRLIFFFIALAIYPSKFVRRSITHQQINASRGIPLAREHRRLAAIVAADVVGYPLDAVIMVHQKCAQGEPRRRESMQFFRNDRSVAKDSFTTAVEYYADVRKGMREKADHNKRESQFCFYSALCFTLATPLFVTWEKYTSLLTRAITTKRQSGGVH
jgi:hypothetical protein